MRRTVVVSSCGTSLIMNGSDEEMRRILNRTANLKEREVPPADRQQIDNRVLERRNELMAASVSEARRLSAEINGIAGFYGGDLAAAGPADIQILLHTDTYQGEQVAQVLAEWLRKASQTVLLASINSLATSSLETFRWGVQELVRWCQDQLANYRKDGYRIVFNLTGGFKGVQGVLNTLGHVYADEIVYVFEGSELIRIPRLPVRLDMGQAVEAHIHLFRRMHNGHKVLASEAAGIPETLVEPDGSKESAELYVTLSILGDIAWQEAYKGVYGRGLLEPPTSRIRYTERFRRDVQAVSEADRLILLNESIDDLDKHLHGRTGNLRSLNLHPVLGKLPLPVITHECYAWSDKDARRIYLHFEDGRGEGGPVAVLDMLGKHL